MPKGNPELCPTFFICVGFFISCFTVSVTPSINTLESSIDFMITIISFISSFEINKANPFPALKAPFPLILVSNLFIVFEIKLRTNTGKFLLVKGVATIVSAFFPKLETKNQKIHLIELF